MWIENGVASIAAYNECRKTLDDPMWIVNREIGITEDGERVAPNDPRAVRVTYSFNLVPYVANEFTGGTYFAARLDQMRCRTYTDERCPLLDMYDNLRAALNKTKESE